MKFLKKLFFWSSFLGMILGGSVLFLAHFVFEDEFLELNLLINKYADINKSQNVGLHKLALIAIQKATFFLPSNDYVDFNRSDDQVGVGEYSRDFNGVLLYEKTVKNTKELIRAINRSEPGTEIIVAPGVYKLKGKKISMSSHGLLNSPIVLKAEKMGDVIFEMYTQSGFNISGSFWRIENIIFKGVKGDKWVEHAIHLRGKVSNIHIINNQFINFNAHIKSNGKKKGKRKKKGITYFPNNITIEHNNFFNEWKRNTKSPVTPIDVVGGKDWLIKNNFIADFGKSGRKGGGVTYGAFLKGGGENGVFDGNLVACEWKIKHTSNKDTRIGLSFGGGGTGKQYCSSKDCKTEFNQGIMRNNTIINCLNDVGVYINKSSNIQIFNNVIRNSLGVDVRYPTSNALIFNNLIEGRIKARDNAIIDQYDNFKKL